MARGKFTALGYVNYGKETFSMPRVSAGQLKDIMAVQGFSLGFSLDETTWFGWCDLAGVASAFGAMLPPQHVLHLRTLDDAMRLLEDHPESYVMVANGSLEMPEELQPYAGNVILVDGGSGSDPLIEVQEIFLRMLRWENQLNYLTNADGSLDELLNIGSSMFDGFILVAGVDNNVIGYSNKTSFPNDAYERMIRGNRLVSSKLFVDAFLTDDFCALTGYVAEVKDEFGNTCVIAPIRYEGSLFGFVVLFVGDMLEVTQGMKDQFAHYSTYVLEKCRAKLKMGVERDLPHFYFLTSLLRGDAFTRATIEQNLNRLDMPLEACYKVVVLNPRDTRLGTDILTDSLRLLNERKSLVVLFEDYVVAILYAEAADGVLSHKKTLDELERYIYRPYGVICGFSQVFNHISDVRYGYQQALYALNSRDAIEVERSMMKEEAPLHGISFEMALPYFMIKEYDVDRGLHEFCMSNSPLESLLQLDLKNDTNNFLLLWLFLLYERNASLVGRRLYMHRNSVLYHIKQIEKRYDFELDDWYAREKLLMDYRFLFLRLPDDVLEKLFKNG